MVFVIIRFVKKNKKVVHYKKHENKTNIWIFLQKLLYTVFK